ncbi:hypothetical protein HMPREF1531_01627 [Propionibacterium sp. oral taxon 192 str. F0372]|uniref:hypothetical protein n=1 Tax=Propionibacterium sp. oral taxon 192 TaxID=671222 RepID=UPI000352C8BE|nr:hypothetical protein [Propionibacterium sp. oral taxon 192]EPH02321.1 hypothetical protein HMPREF1531_01627 [Propionibacterium sp. oral taxon 192 str. F0372]
MAPAPDFRSIVEDLTSLAAQWQRTHEEVNSFLATAGGVITCEEFAMRTTPSAQIAELVFTPRAQAITGAQLRELVLTSYANLLTSANAGLADRMASMLGIPDLMTGIRSTAPEDIAERATIPAPEPEQTTEPTPEPETSPGEAPRLSLAEVEEWVEANVDPDQDLDVDTFLYEDLRWDPNAQTDPTLADKRLKKQAATMSERSTELARNLEQIRAESSSTKLIITVNGGGRLIDVEFRPAFSVVSADELTEDFRRVYADACEQASAQALQVFDEGDTQGEDPTRSLFNHVHEDALRITASPEPDDD